MARVSKQTITQSTKDRLNEMAFTDIETLLNKPLEPNRTYKIDGSKFGYKSVTAKVRFSLGLIVDFNYATPSASVQSVNVKKK